MDEDGRLCHACGRRWQARDQRRYTALGLRLRRSARHRGVRGAWAHPRPADRCPSCASRELTTIAVPSDPTAGPLAPLRPERRFRDQPVAHDRRRGAHRRT